MAAESSDLFLSLWGPHFMTSFNLIIPKGSTSNTILLGVSTYEFWVDTNVPP